MIYGESQENKYNSQIETVHKYDNKDSNRGLERFEPIKDGKNNGRGFSGKVGDVIDNGGDLIRVYTGI